MTLFAGLIILAMLLSIAALVKPAWPFVAVAALLICIALLIGKT